jgi:hypothetical protein
VNVRVDFASKTLTATTNTGEVVSVPCDIPAEHCRLAFTLWHTAEIALVEPKLHR